MIAQEIENHRSDRILDRDGFAVARQLFRADEVALILNTFMDLAKDGPVEGISEIKHSATAYAASDPLAKYPRMNASAFASGASVGPLSRKYLIEPRLHSILKEMLRDEPLAVQSMFYFKPPGARGQALHQDNFYLRVKPGTCLAAWIALDDADEGNGGMVCVPQTQSLEIACPEKADSRSSSPANTSNRLPGRHQCRSI